MAPARPPRQTARTPRTPIQPHAVTFGLLAALQQRTTLDSSTITAAVLIACAKLISVADDHVGKLWDQRST